MAAMEKVPMELVERIQDRAVIHDFNWLRVFLHLGISVGGAMAILWLIAPHAVIHQEDVYEVRMTGLMACTMMTPVFLPVFAHMEYYFVRNVALHRNGITIRRTRRRYDRP